MAAGLTRDIESYADMIVGLPMQKSHCSRHTV